MKLGWILWPVCICHPAGALLLWLLITWVVVKIFLLNLNHLVASLSRSCLFSSICTGPVLVAPSAVAVAIVQDIIAYHWLIGYWLEYHLNRQNIVVHLNSILDSVSPWSSSTVWHLYRPSSDTSVQLLSNATSDPYTAANSKVKGHLWLSFKLLQPTSTDKASLIPWSTPGPLRLPQSLVDCPTHWLLF